MILGFCSSGAVTTKTSKIQRFLAKRSKTSSEYFPKNGLIVFLIPQLNLGMVQEKDIGKGLRD